MISTLSVTNLFDNTVSVPLQMSVCAPSPLQTKHWGEYGQKAARQRNRSWKPASDSTLLASSKKTLAKYIGPSDRGVSGWLVNRRPRSCSHSGPRSHHASSLVWYSDLLIAQRPRPSVKPTTFHWLSIVGTKK